MQQSDTSTLNVNNWRSEAKATVVLGLPLVSAQLAQTAINVTNTVVLGRIGPEELAAAVLGWQLFFVAWIFGTGFGFAVMPLIANALGARAQNGINKYVSMGILVCLIYSVIMMIPLWFSNYIFLFLGQDPYIAELATEYVRILQWSLFPQLAVIVMRSLLGALHKPNIVVVALVGGAIVNAILNMVFVLGFFNMPSMGMSGAALSTLISTTGIAIFLFFYVKKHHTMRSHNIFVLPIKLDMAAFIEVFRLGWPIGITIVAEVGLFTATSIMMGWIGALELAAHGIALQLTSLAFMVPLGLSAAATVRVGWAFGRKDKHAVMLSAKVAIIIGLLLACMMALLFVSAPGFLIGLFLNLDDQHALQAVPFAIKFLLVAAAFQIVDSLQVLSNGSLRGLKDARIPMVLALISYWVIGMPIGYVLAFKFNLGGMGIWYGLATGLAFAATLLTIRLYYQIRSIN